MSGVGVEARRNPDGPPPSQRDTFPASRAVASWSSGVVGIPAVRDRGVAQGTQSCGEWSLYERPSGWPEAQDRSKTPPSLLDSSSVAAGLCQCGEPAQCSMDHQ